MKARVFRDSLDRAEAPREQRLPTISKNLLEALEGMFPDRAARRGQSLDEIMFDAGAAFVVRKMRADYEEQNSFTDPVLNPNRTA